jgi:tetratricopeptide (TPR) repeat protein
MMSKITIRIPVVCLVLILGPVAGFVGAATIEEMLEEKSLVSAFNPELLDYLIEEGRDVLPPEQRQEALDQLVSALKQDIDITPEEQRAAAMAAAGAGIAQLLGGTNGAGYGGVAQDATHQIWSGWVDSAFTMQRAGYADEADAFFKKCVEVFPYSDLRGRCAIGLALAHPNEAYDRLTAILEANDNETIKAVLPLLGELAGSEGFPADLRGQVITKLGEFTGGMKKATFGVAACRGLVATGDERAVPTLQKLSSGMMNPDFFPCARTGLLLSFGDRSVVPMLEKQLKGGTFSTTTPNERLFAASLLMRAGEASGFTFAEKELTKKQKKGLGKFMKSKEDKVDLRPALVSALVRAGSSDAIRVLKASVAAVEKGSWLETWIAVGLLELGDTSQIGLAKAALGKPDWAFTTVRIATALAENGDFSGVSALNSLYRSAAGGVEPDWGKATLAFLAGEGGEFQSGEKAKKARLIRLRRQIAWALSEIDQPDCVAILTSILADSEPSVRAAAAYGLAAMKKSEAAAGLTAAMPVDYGSVGEATRNPVVQAHLVRAADQRFADQEESGGTIEAGLASAYNSVRFLSLCIGKPSTDQVESEG